MKLWYKSDWLGKDKPTKKELIRNFYIDFCVWLISIVLCFFSVIISIFFINAVGLAIFSGVLALIFDAEITKDKENYYRFYGMRGD